MRRIGRLVTVAGLLLSAIILQPGPVRAGGEPMVIGRPVTDEPGTRLLRLNSFQTSVFDLDGDGIRELIRLESRTNDPGLAQVTAMSIGQDGTPTPLFSTPLQREVSVDERSTPGLRGEFTAAQLSDNIQIVEMRIHGAKRLIVAVSGYNPDYTYNCCLTLWTVEWSDDLHGLRLLDTTGRPFDSLTVADLDADGTDELVATESITDGTIQNAQLSLYRWDGTDLQRMGIDALTQTSSLYPTGAGETDGVAGDDVLVVETGGPIRLHRLSLRSGAANLETGNIEGIWTARVVDADVGQIVASGEPGTGISLYRWPRDRPMEPVARWSASADLIGVIGTDDSTRVLLAPQATDYGYGLDVILLDKISYPSIPRPDRVEVTRGLDQANPYLGPTVPGVGPDGAFLYAGQIVEPAGPGLDVRLTQISLMAGLWPIGTAGPDNAWAVVQTQTQSGRGRLETRIVATNSLLTPHEEPLTPTFRGAAAGEDGVLFIKADAQPVAEIVVPGGSRVISKVGFSGGTLIDVPLPAGSRPAHPTPVSIPITKVGGSQRSPYQVRIVVITPAGHAYQGIWQVQPIAGPPDLDVRAPQGVFSSGVIRGATTPLAQVTMNGAPVQVATNGVFVAELPLAFLPTEIRLVATDPLGQTSQVVFSILNPVDYRRLPWIPIVAVLTAVGGVIWWIRAPRRRPPGEISTTGAGTFEEIEI